MKSRRRQRKRALDGFLYSLVRAVQMEEPVKFNLWGRIIPDRREEALTVVRQQAVFPSEIELRKAVMSAIRTNEQMQISAAYGLGAVTDLANSLGTTFTDLTLCQECYWPAGEKTFCSEHNLHFGGCLGCHICSGFYRA